MENWVENKTKKKGLKENVNELLVAFESTQLSGGGREDNCLFIEPFEGRISSLAIGAQLRAGFCLERTWIISREATYRRRTKNSPISWHRKLIKSSSSGINLYLTHLRKYLLNINVRDNAESWWKKNYYRWKNQWSLSVGQPNGESTSLIDAVEQNTVECGVFCTEMDIVRRLPRARVKKNTWRYEEGSPIEFTSVSCWYLLFNSRNVPGLGLGAITHPNTGQKTSWQPRSVEKFK